MSPSGVVQWAVVLDGKIESLWLVRKSAELHAERVGGFVQEIAVSYGDGR